MHSKIAFLFFVGFLDRFTSASFSCTPANASPATSSNITRSDVTASDVTTSANEEFPRILVPCDLEGLCDFGEPSAKLIRRQSLMCPNDFSCLSSPSNQLACYNSRSGDYIVQGGLCGNAFRGAVGLCNPAILNGEPPRAGSAPTTQPPSSASSSGSDSANGAQSSTSSSGSASTASVQGNASNSTGNSTASTGPTSTFSGRSATARASTSQAGFEVDQASTGAKLLLRGGSDLTLIQAISCLAVVGILMVMR